MGVNRIRGLGLWVAVASLGAAPAAGQDSAPLTRAEASGFTETTRHAEAEAFLRAVAEASPLISLTSFGYSMEGRTLWLAVVGDTEATPQAVRASGKTRVYIQGNIHAGEVEGKEAMLALLREIGSGAHRGWLDSMVLLVAPIYNADGNERIALTNRRLQHGPTGGMGQRPNAQGYDLNRDHMKLESPEARAFARMLRDYDPHVLIDLHTTNGTHHGYHLTYAPPLHPNTGHAHRGAPAGTAAPEREPGYQGPGRLGLLLLREPATAGVDPAAGMVHVRSSPPVRQQLRRTPQPRGDSERGVCLFAV